MDHIPTDVDADIGTEMPSPHCIATPNLPTNVPSSFLICYEAPMDGVTSVASATAVGEVFHEARITRIGQSIVFAIVLGFSQHGRYLTGREMTVYPHESRQSNHDPLCILGFI